MRRLADKVVVVTGGGGGIGRALGEAFGRAGCRVALVDRDPGSLERAGRILHSLGPSLHRVDVRERADLERARDEIIARHGGVDILINNAGVTVFSALEAMDDAEIDRILAVNLRAVIDGCRVFLPALRERQWAQIVNTSSIAGIAGFPWQSLYCATKFAVRGFSLALRSELAVARIGVTCVIPGATRTGILVEAGGQAPALTGALSNLLEAHGYPPAWLARKVVRAVRWNRAFVTSGPDGLALRIADRVAPTLVRATMRAVARVGRPRVRAESDTPA